MTELHLRALTKEERHAAFASAKAPSFDIASYRLAVARMQPGIGYAIEINGVSPRATRVRFNRAAKLSGRKLRWSGATKADARELFVELA